VLVSIVDVGALSAFALLHLSVIGYFAVRRQAKASSLHIAIPMVGIVVTVWVLAESSRSAQVIGALWLALGLMVSAAARVRDASSPPVSERQSR
jgi:hypothetical protein